MQQHPKVGVVRMVAKRETHCPHDLAWHRDAVLQNKRDDPRHTRRTVERTIMCMRYLLVNHCGIEKPPQIIGREKTRFARFAPRSRPMHRCPVRRKCRTATKNIRLLRDPFERRCARRRSVLQKLMNAFIASIDVAAVASMVSSEKVLELLHGYAVWTSDRCCAIKYVLSRHTSDCR